MIAQIASNKETCQTALVFLIVIFVESKVNPCKQANGDERQSVWEHFNYVAYKTNYCDPAGNSCDPTDRLVCAPLNGTGRCMCLPKHVYVRRPENCWRIPKSMEEPCHHDVQCQAGRWGRLSRCSKHTSKCECYNYKTNENDETALVDGVCYIQKVPGDHCQNHEDCYKTMTLNMRGISVDDDAICKRDDTGSHDSARSCQCRDTHIWYIPMKKCLKIATQLGDPCFKTDQCRYGPLGKFSRCNFETNVCECDGRDSSSDAIHHKKLNKCFPKRYFNESCEDDEECRISLGSEVRCGLTNEFVSENVCHCPKGIVCRRVFEDKDRNECRGRYNHITKMCVESSSVKFVVSIALIFNCYFVQLL